MPVQEWPAGDQAAWAAATADGGLLEQSGVAAHWRPDARYIVEKSYGRFLTFLTRCGQLNSAETPVDRVSKDALRAYFHDLSETVAPITAAGRIRDLAEMLKVMQPDANLRWLGRVSAKLKARAPRSRNKAMKVRSPRTLIELGVRSIVEAERALKLPERLRAVRYRDGLMVIILAICAPRSRNFCSMELGRSIQRTPSGWKLHFPAEEGKTHRLQEFALPAPLTPVLDRYVECYRATLMGTTQHSSLWVAQYGNPMAEKSIAIRVKAFTANGLGVGINLHLLRDCIATSAAFEDPALTSLAAAILNHQPATTMRSYDHSHSIAAVKRYQEQIMILRQKLRKDMREHGGPLLKSRRR